MSFESLGLSPVLTQNCARAGYTTPSPIQTRAIPLVLAGRDLLAAAQTGTGKTAAFLLPLLHQMAGEPPLRPRHPRTLVLTPTRELAAQIDENARIYGAGIDVRSVLIFGGVSQRPQETALARGADLVIATPGRLLDLCNQGAINLSRVNRVVLDEADRMLDMGFIRDLRRILKLLPQKRQTLLFSATFSKDIRELAGSFLSNPETVEVAPRNAPADLVTQQAIMVPKHAKRALTAWLISSGNWRQVLVFARTKHGSDRLARQLEQDGLSAAALHGGKSQGARTRALAAFKAGQTRVLVATDIAARGLDIDQLPHVINYELPMVPEDYVHRIGRTGRAGESGHAVSLIGEDERGLLKDVERVLGRPVERLEVPGFQVPPRPAQAETEPRRADAPRPPRGNGAGRNVGSRSSKPASKSAASKSGGQRRGGGKPSAGGARRAR
jgi:ATP-dependent RNA helicase RhlE